MSREAAAAAQKRKGELYQELKAAGVEFTKPYAKYTVAELEAGQKRLHELEAAARQKLEEHANGVREDVPTAPEPARPAPEPKVQPQQAQLPPVAQGREELPGERLNRPDYGEPIEIDDAGRIWFQKEIRKPATAKPRGRRVLRYQAKDTKVVMAKDSGDGHFTESIEVAGDGPARDVEVKITLPSYQVGIYTRKGLPFRVFTYDSNEGFDFFEVCNYYGGAELVPPTCKRKYVSNVLCWDIPSVVNTIRAEFRHLQLTGKI